jgi:hypothetical protein
LVAIPATTHGFIAYYGAARLLVTGRFGPWVYDDPTFIRYVQELTGSSVIEIFGPNTPAMSALALPVALLNPAAARAAWLIGSIAAYVAACRWLGREAIRNRPMPPAATALLLLMPAVFANLRTAQAYLVVCAATAAAAVLLLRRRDGLAGALIGAVLLLKTSGAMLLLVAAARGRWRAIGAAAAVAVGGVLLLWPWAGLDTWLRYVDYTRAFIARPSGMVTAYQTTFGLARHLCTFDATWNPGPAAACADAARIAPVLLLGCALIVTIVAALRATDNLWIGAGVCLSVLALPVVEDHQLVLLGIPMLLLLGGDGSTAGHARRLIWVVFGLLMIAPIEWLGRHFGSGWSALAAYPRLYAAWLLWALTLRRMLVTRGLVVRRHEVQYDVS